MQIIGKVIKCNQCYGKIAEATIELPPVNPQNIKEGDEVWVKHKVTGHNFNALLTKTNYSSMGIEIVDTIAHFPQAKPEEKYCLCKEPRADIAHRICGNCMKLVKEAETEEKLVELEEVSFGVEPVLERCGMLARVVNQLIRYLKGKE